MKLLTLMMSKMLHKVEVHLAKLEARKRPAITGEMADGIRLRPGEVQPRLEQATSLASHYWLRQLLAERIGCSPGKLPIVVQQGGKPCLAGREIEFSLSHCDNWCAVALSTDCPVGVDVEIIHPVKDLPELASNFIPPGARVTLDTAPTSLRHEEFLRSWTRVEAAVKACGRGLDDARSCLDQVIVESCDDVPGVALSVAGQCTGALDVDWRLPEPYAVLNECLARPRG